MLHALLVISHRLLTNLFVLLLPAIGYALLLPALGYALLLPAVDYTLLLLTLLLFLLCLLGFGLVTHRPSPFFGFMLCSAIWCCLFRRLIFITGSSGCDAVSVLCPSSIAAHRDLNHLCAARRLLRAVCSSSCTLS